MQRELFALGERQSWMIWRVLWPAVCTEHPEFHSGPTWQGWSFLLSQHWTLTPAACSFFHPEQPHSALSVTFSGSIFLKECGDPINSIISRHLGFFIVWGFFVVKWLTLKEMLGYKISAKLGFNLLMFKAMAGAEFQLKGVALDFCGNRRRGKEHFWMVWYPGSTLKYKNWLWGNCYVLKCSHYFKASNMKESQGDAWALSREGNMHRSSWGKTVSVRKDLCLSFWLVIQMWGINKE